MRRLKCLIQLLVVPPRIAMPAFMPKDDIVVPTTRLEFRVGHDPDGTAFRPRALRAAERRMAGFDDAAQARYTIDSVVRRRVSSPA